METLQAGTDVLFILLGAIRVLAMHAGFAFLEVGTVRHKNQVNALVKIICDFAVSTIGYFFIGYGVAYGMGLLQGAEALTERNGYELVKFFFLLTFAAAIPAIISGGIAERARFYPQLAATFLLVALIYPFFEGITWNGNFGVQAWIEAQFGATFHDFAGSIVVHALGGLGGVSLGAQLVGTALGIGAALVGGFLVYGLLKAVMGLRLTQEEEYQGADLSIHRIRATPEYDR
jgi:ammonium transporter, Amt family